MGFFDKLKQSAKDVTGLGLSASEQYARAYSKGVFLQPPNYKAAAKNFFEARDKFNEEGNKEMAFHSYLNGMLYDFYSDRNPNSIDDLITNLGKMDEIERIGSDTETVPTSVLVKELSGFKLESLGRNTTDHKGRSKLFKEAGDHYLSIGNERFTFIEAFKPEGPLENGISRGYFLLALSDYHSAMFDVQEDPDNAQNMLHRALTGFKRSHDDGWTTNVEGFLDRLKKKRHCWMCTREVQGEDIYYRHYPTDLTPYYRHVVEKGEQDMGMLEKEGHVTVCSACGSVIERQSDLYATRRANEVRSWAEPKFSNHDREIASLWSEVRSLRASMAFHNR